MTQLAIAWGTDDKAHRERLRALLADGRRHTQTEMRRAGGDRYGARLMELRRAGLCVRTSCVGQGIYEYQLQQPPGQAGHTSGVGATAGGGPVTLTPAPEVAGRRLSRREVERLCAVWRAAL